MIDMEQMQKNLGNHNSSSVNFALLLAMVMMILLAFFVSACSSLHQDGNLAERRLQVKEEVFSEKIPLDDLSDSHLKSVAHYYSTNGDGPVTLALTYDPSSSFDTAMAASRELARLASLLRRNGAPHVDGRILPVQEGAGQVMLAFHIYTAHAPEGCGLMAGTEGRSIDFDKNYDLGCTVDTMIARQIARPKDLIGRHQADPTTDARVVGGAAARYQFGEPNGELGGETTTE